MITKTAIFLSFGVIPAWFAPQAKADAHSTARMEINRKYYAINTASAKPDNKAVLGFNSPNFRAGIARNQAQTAKIHGRYVMLHAWRMAYNDAQSLKIQTSIQRFKLKNNVATVVLKDFATIVYRDRDAQVTKSQVIITTATETWVKNNNHWQLLRSYTFASKQMPPKTLT